MNAYMYLRRYTYDVYLRINRWMGWANLSDVKMPQSRYIGNIIKVSRSAYRISCRSRLLSEYVTFIFCPRKVGEHLLWYTVLAAAEINNVVVQIQRES